MKFEITSHKRRYKARTFAKALTTAIDTLEQDITAHEETAKIYKARGLSKLAEAATTRANILSGTVYVLRHELLPLVMRRAAEPDEQT